MLPIPNFDQIFPHWWSHIISYNKTLIGLKFYREIHTVLQCFRYSKTKTTPIVKFRFWIRHIILLVTILYKSECLNRHLYFSTANICQLQICKVHVFKEGHKNWLNLHLQFYCLLSKCQIDGDYFFNFCGLLRKHEL